MQPKYSPFLTREQRIEIRELIGRLIDVMEEIAVDDRHCPKLYAKFLAGLLATPMASVDHKNVSPRSMKAKSESPSSKRIELHNAIHLPGRGTASNPASARPSASPPPFDADEHGHAIAGADHVHELPPLTNELPTFGSNFFTPLPLEPEFVQSMQTLGDQTGWQDMVVHGKFPIYHHNIRHGFHLWFPGFSWMQPPEPEMDMSSYMPMNGAMPLNGSM